MSFPRYPNNGHYSEQQYVMFDYVKYRVIPKKWALRKGEVKVFPLQAQSHLGLEVWINGFVLSNVVVREWPVECPVFFFEEKER